MMSELSGWRGTAAHPLMSAGKSVVQDFTAFLGVEQGKVIFGITAEPNDERPPSLAALCDTPVTLQKETIND